MRVAFLGKGGSGKTTICASFIKHVESKQKHVLGIDADVNRHLPWMLGFEGQPKSLGSNVEEIYDYVKGDRTDVEKLIASTPPSKGSTLVYSVADDPFVCEYALQNESKTLSVLSVGRYEQEDVGDSCYHGKLYSAASVLHHMIDQKDDWIVADSTAGTDGVATSLYFAYDAYVYVVEPTLKSIQVYRDFIEATQKQPKPVFVIVNKASEEDKDFVEQHINPKSIIAYVGASSDLRKFEQGDIESFEHFWQSLSNEFDLLTQRLNAIERDPEAYYQKLTEYHNDLAQSWGNTYYQADLNFKADPTFDYRGLFQSTKVEAA